MNKKKQLFSVVVPVYNEEKVIKKVLREIKRTLKKEKVRFEIIVVNDGSTDSSGQILEKEKGIRILAHSKNKGYGATIKTGVMKAKFENIIMIDGDNTYSPQDISLLIKNFKDEEMIVGARIGKKIHESFLRKIMKKILVLLASYLVEEKIPDLNSGLRILKKDKFIRFFHLLPSGFSLTSTLTLAFLANDYSLKFVPIGYHSRMGKSKIKPVRDTLNFFQLILRTILYFNPLKVFAPLSLFFFLSSLLVGLYSFFFLPKFMDASTVILFVTGFQILLIGVVADLISKSNARFDQSR